MGTRTRDRWSPDLVRAAVDALHGRGDIVAASFGDVDGYLDFRDLPFTDVAETPVAESSGSTLTEIVGYADVQSVRWEGLDLSGASMRSTRLTDVTVSRCRFVGTDLTDLRMWNTHLDHCVFDRATMNDASVGAWYEGKGCSFISCSFVKTKTRDFMSDAGEFSDCVFDVRLKSERYMSTVFDHCTFRGRYTEVVFDGRDLQDATGRPGRNTMAGCDFSQADLDDVQFNAIDARNLVLPDTGDWVVIPDFTRTAAAALRWLHSPAAADYPQPWREFMMQMIAAAHPDAMAPGEAAAFNLADFRDASAPGIEEIARHALDAAARAA